MPLIPVRRTLQVLAFTFVALFLVSLLKGRGVAGGLEFAAFWAVATTAVFAATRWYHGRKSRDCALCEDGQAESEDEEDRASVLNM